MRLRRSRVLLRHDAFRDSSQCAGYAGYVPAKLPPAKPTAIQAALWEVRSQESLEAISKLLRNAAVNPKEEKFRRIRLQNDKIQSLILQQSGALEALLLLGWERNTSDGDQLVISPGKYFSMSEASFSFNTRFHG